MFAHATDNPVVARQRVFLLSPNKLLVIVEKADFKMSSLPYHLTHTRKVPYLLVSSVDCFAKQFFGTAFNPLSKVCNVSAGTLCAPIVPVNGFVNAPAPQAIAAFGGPIVTNDNESSPLVLRQSVRGYVNKTPRTLDRKQHKGSGKKTSRTNVI